MFVDSEKEREYFFEHMWRQVDKKFYVKDLHGVDWSFYKNEYKKFLPHINNDFDFAQMMSEMLGELNASHTGCRHYSRSNTGDNTASLGLYLKHLENSNGLRILDIMDKSPVIDAKSKIKIGDIIEKIDGVTITPSSNIASLLNRKEGKNTLLSIYNGKNRWEETVKPISRNKENTLRYERWIENCRSFVDSISDGKIGYVHIKSMSDHSYRPFYEDVLGKNHLKDALIVDTRFNGGGWMHDDLVVFLSGTKYFTFYPRGQNLGGESLFRWQKPSAVVMGEGNYSDAHVFPVAYKELGVGKLIGMPVPGTGTAVWWEMLHNESLVFGIPQVGILTDDGKYLENTQLEPDFKIANKPEKISSGWDEQLQKAVEHLIQETKNE